ncbi:unnamed protein product [Effrenium voratum]|nr:unnamed protein product [Effrenium voratum]
MDVPDSLALPGSNADFKFLRMQLLAWADRSVASRQQFCPWHTTAHPLTSRWWATQGRVPSFKASGKGRPGFAGSGAHPEDAFQHASAAAFLKLTKSMLQQASELAADEKELKFKADKIIQHANAPKRTLLMETMLHSIQHKDMQVVRNGHAFSAPTWPGDGPAMAR